MLKISHLLPLCAMLWPISANAAVLDFEGLAPGAVGTSYAEDGFTVTAGASLQALNSSGSIGLMGPIPFFNANSSIRLAQNGGGAFDFQSIVIAAADSNGLGVPLTFQATRQDGTSFFYSVNLPEYGFTTAIPATRTLLDLPDSFDAVVAVTWGNGAEFHQFDDVTVVPISAAVPEPATWAMMIAGFATVGWAARRRGSAQAASQPISR